jgi:hypothetical protein
MKFTIDDAEKETKEIEAEYERILTMKNGIDKDLAILNTKIRIEMLQIKVALMQNKLKNPNNE